VQPGSGGDAAAAAGGRSFRRRLLLGMEVDRVVQLLQLSFCGFWQYGGGAIMPLRYRTKGGHSERVVQAAAAASSARPIALGAGGMDSKLDWVHCVGLQYRTSPEEP
jgi:hypothetical protein